MGANAPARIAQRRPAPLFGALGLRGNSNLHMSTAMRILVTGGSGFLGSHLCDRLVERATM
jgi:hypothetical protein